MTTRNLTIVSTAATMLFGLSAATTTAAQQDDLAGYAHMFNPSGWQLPNAAPHLMGGAPPVLGQPATMHIDAPGAAFAGVLVGGRATRGIQIDVGTGPLTLYIDPLRIWSSYSVPLDANGQGQFQLPIPPDPQLMGLDLAWQGVVASPLGQIGTTNLMAMNIGNNPFVGNMALAFDFTDTIPADGYLTDAQNRPEPIYCNNSDRAVQVTIKGTRSASGGRLEIRNHNNPRGGNLGTVPAGQTRFNITVTVQPGQKLYLYNQTDYDGSGRRSGPITVDWTVSVTR